MRRPFDEVVEEHGGTVLRVCRALLARADADDAWSETFLAALRAYPALPEGANLEAWLVTIARRKALDALRAERRRPVPLAEPPDRVSDQHEPEAADRLWVALRALPPKQRAVLAARHLGGLSHAEVAALVGGTPEASRRAASDGLRALRRHFTDIPEEEPQ